MKKLIFGMVLVFGLVLMGCGSGGDYAAADAPAAAMDAVPEAVAEAPMEAEIWADAAADVAWDYGSFDDAADYAIETSALAPIAAAAETPRARLLIQRAQMTMTAETVDFNDTVENLRNAAGRFGGYVESSNLRRVWSDNFEVAGHARNFSITLRVPVARFEAAYRHVEGYGDVLDLNLATDDVTGQMADFARRMEVRLVEEARLLELVEEAQNLQQLFTIEDRLTQVRHHIEFYRGAMAATGDQAAFSTISVNLWELLEYIETPDEEEEEEGYTFGQRVGGAFATSVSVTGAIVQGIIVFIAAAIIPLLAFGLLGLVVYLIVRAVIKHAAARAPKSKPPVHPPYNPSYYYQQPPEANQDEAGQEKDDGDEV